jgi:hypothetical protein
MDICANCDKIQGHFLEPKTGHAVCSKLCAQELVDAFYKLQPYPDENENDMDRVIEDIVIGGRVLYQGNGIKVDVYDKQWMHPPEFEKVEKLLMDIYTNNHLCDPVGVQYFPSVLLQPTLQFISIAYSTTTDQNYKKAVLGVLFASETVPGDRETITIDLVCSPAVRNENGGIIKLKLGPLMVQKFVEYIYEYEPQTLEIVLTALKSYLISFYGVLGFSLFPAIQEKYGGHLMWDDFRNTLFHQKYNPELERNETVFEWTREIDGPLRDWFARKRTEFLQYMRTYGIQYKKDKDYPIENVIPQNVLELSHIPDHGYLMRYTREEFEQDQEVVFERYPAVLRNRQWDSLVFEVDEELSKKFYYLYTQLKARYNTYLVNGISRDQIDDLIAEVFLHGPVRNTNVENLDKRIVAKEFAVFGEGWNKNV